LMLTQFEHELNGATGLGKSTWSRERTSTTTGNVRLIVRNHGESPRIASISGPRDLSAI
jgi:hypothetical protein